MKSFSHYKFKKIKIKITSHFFFFSNLKILNIFYVCGSMQLFDINFTNKRFHILEEITVELYCSFHKLILLGFLYIG